MTQAVPLNRDERYGLALALAGHAALVAVLVLYKPAIVVPPPPERMTVTISDETGPTATSPEPQAVPIEDKGPELGDSPPPPAPVEQAIPEPQPKPVVTPPKPAPAPAPAPKVAPKPPPPAPAPKPAARKPVPQPRSAAPAARPAPRTTGKPGSAAFNNLFSNGIPAGKPAGRSNSAPAPASGQMKSSWSSLIGSKISKFWDDCPVSGLDTELLFANVHFTLAIDRSIASIDDFEVRGVTAANRAQVAPFKTCVYKSIRRAAPFSELPKEYYDDWKSRNLRFSKKRRP